MLKKIRTILALVMFIGITLLFVDFTGTAHVWLSWMAKVQFLPAVLALNFVVVAILLIITLLFGRIYCSVICPLGILQDIFGWLGKKFGVCFSFFSNFRKHFSILDLTCFLVSKFATFAPKTK